MRNVPLKNIWDTHQVETRTTARNPPLLLGHGAAAQASCSFCNLSFYREQESSSLSTFSMLLLLLKFLLFWLKLIASIWKYRSAIRNPKNGSKN